MGQFIHVVPDLDLVVVTTSREEVDFDRILSLLETYIIAAVAQQWRDRLMIEQLFPENAVYSIDRYCFELTRGIVSPPRGRIATSAVLCFFAAFWSASPSVPTEIKPISLILFSETAFVTNIMSFFSWILLNR